MPLDSRNEELRRATVPIAVNGATLLADPLGAAVEPMSGTLIVADLHFEKGSGLARRGLLLPPYDTRATLGALEADIRAGVVPRADAGGQRVGRHPVRRETRGACGDA